MRSGIPDDQSDEVQALAAQLDTARGRLELLRGDAATVLTETPSEAELGEQRALAEWRRRELRDAEKAELTDQLAAAESLRQASKSIRDADIRDAIDARKALAAQRRAETPASTVAELHRYSRWTRYGCAAIIGAGMVWSAINVQKNMAPGGMSDPLFWASFLIEGMISGLLVIIALGTAKVRDAAQIQPSPGTRYAEVGLFLLTLGLNTYPYLSRTEWYAACLHAVAPVMIGATLLTLHSLGADYARARTVVAKAMTGPVELPELPAVRTAHPVGSYRVAESETAQRALGETVQGSQTAHRAVEELERTAHRAAEARVETAQFPRTAQTNTAQDDAADPVETPGGDTAQPRVHTEQRTVEFAHLAPASAEYSIPAELDRDSTESSEHAPTAAGVELDETAQNTDGSPREDLDVDARTVQPAWGDADPEEAGARTASEETAQFPRTLTETAQGTTAHRAPAGSTAHRAGGDTAHPTAQDRTAHRAPKSATIQHGDDEAVLRVLAAEVHGRLNRTRFSVEDVARVLIAHRRDGLGPDRIYRDKIGPHRSVTTKWLQHADDIERERAADMAPVITLRDRG